MSYNTRRYEDGIRKALQALYVGSILDEMPAGIMDAEEGAEKVERMFFHATTE